MHWDLNGWRKNLNNQKPKEKANIVQLLQMVPLGTNQQLPCQSADRVNALYKGWVTFTNNLFLEESLLQAQLSQILLHLLSPHLLTNSHQLYLGYDSSGTKHMRGMCQLSLQGSLHNFLGYSVVNGFPAPIFGTKNVQVNEHFNLNYVLHVPNFLLIYY